ncbi:MAG: carbohydrate-binding domain-containing protein [Atopobiaceae bacterium]|nr:carbohydrate-binding domain-containing protein [Atopobiaceae bacterium]
MRNYSEEAHDALQRAVILCCGLALALFCALFTPAIAFGEASTTDTETGALSEQARNQGQVPTQAQTPGQAQGQAPGQTQVPGQAQGQAPGQAQGQAQEQTQVTNGVTMYRLYNPNSGEHFYTSNTTEKNQLVKLGWRDEGIGWIAPTKSNTPVYRLYNPNAGDHHYTTSAGEKNALVKLGWRYEGIGWYSDDAKTVALYRQYNPNAQAGTHNYTTNKAENDQLVSIGWKGEGIGWYALQAGTPAQNTQNGQQGQQPPQPSGQTQPTGQTQPSGQTTTTPTTNPTSADVPESSTASSTVDAATLAEAFTFSENAVTAAASAPSSSYSIDGTTLTIKEAGTYVVTGSCSNGNIVVKKGTTGVTLVLADLTLTSTTSAPVACNKTTEVTIQVEGTTTITDAEDPANETSTDTAVADAFEGAAIKAKSGSQLTITGSGALNINSANCKNGIKGASEAAISIADSVTVNVNAANNGIASDGSLNITGGTIIVRSGNDAIKSEPDEDDTTSAGTITISGGSFTLVSTGDAIQASGNISITGGAFQIWSGDDAIHTEATLDIGTLGAESGPQITVESCVEGLEGAIVNLNSGSANVKASDDGVNAANADLGNYPFAINVNGGTWYVDAGGDGFDSNGTITNAGGICTVFGSANAGNAAMDIGDKGGSWKVSGGTIAAVGMNGMAITPTSGTYVSFSSAGMGGMGGMGGQPAMMPMSDETDELVAETTTAETSTSEEAVLDEQAMRGGQQPGQMGQQPGQMGQQTGTVNITAGSTITIKDAAGNVLFETVAPKSANSVVFAAANLSAGQSYTLYVNGSAAASSTAVSR